MFLMTHWRSLRIERLEARELLDAAGVTIITHGAQVVAGLPDWEVTLGQAILDRADGSATDRTTGSIFRHDQTTGRWSALDNSVWTNSNSAAEHVVLLYDWSQESGALNDGWAEAAADSLFASLVDDNDYLSGDLTGQSFYELGLETPAIEEGGLLDFHFIGHSRGTVVNSLVTERFDHYFSTMIDHVTTLDGHPASAMNDQGYVSTDPNNNSRIFTYNNVLFADNYYQQNGSYEPVFFDFNGVRTNGAYNLRLPTTVLENGGGGLEHSDVHTWYYGTVTEPFDSNYSGFNAAGRNNDGDVSFPDSWWGNSGVPARDAIGFHFSEIAGGSRAGLEQFGSKIDAGSIETVNNGDFRFNFGVFSDNPPGWIRHGGSGTGDVDDSGDYLELDAAGNASFRRHNPLWFDVNTVAVEYDYQIYGIEGSSPDDQLQVIIGDTVIESLLLSSINGSFVIDHQAPLSFTHGGFVDTLEFRINDSAGDGIDSAVRIDNIRLVTSIPAPDADFNKEAAVSGFDFLTWQTSAGIPLGAVNAQGDADFDGNIDLDDLTVWQQQYGTSSLVAAATLQIPTAPLFGRNIWLEPMTESQKIRGDKEAIVWSNWQPSP
ncbi:hypothetical protein [Adhaeretor mobilis]|uniref:Uncharacterized protein n=1 Tax=Adhaeretor mobilis TaxID=1930276 RepID=A0A517MT53_9BACT|nr:hypothetical protein [Adhaeretor mobilis]QDS98032.1 hypothetical protein HG15A2_13020 [Adhaeretor mobilis]